MSPPRPDAITGRVVTRHRAALPVARVRSAARRRGVVLASLLALLLLQWLAALHAVTHHHPEGAAAAAHGDRHAHRGHADAGHDHPHASDVAPHAPAATWLQVAAGHDEGSLTCQLIDQLLSPAAWTMPAPDAVPRATAAAVPSDRGPVRLRQAAAAYQARAPPAA